MRLQCSHVNRRAMEKKLLEWLNSNLGEVLESPRKEIFKGGSPPQNFKIVEVNENKKLIKVKFMRKGTLLPLEFWRFDKVIRLVARGDWIRLGTRLSADDPSTIEWDLQEYWRLGFQNCLRNFSRAPSRIHSRLRKIFFGR